MAEDLGAAAAAAEAAAAAAAATSADAKSGTDDAAATAAAASAQELASFKERYTAPEQYTLTPTKDTALPPPVVESTAALARELGLSQPMAEKLLPFAESTVTRYREALAAANEPEKGAAWLARVGEWDNAIKADPELGATPERLETTRVNAKRALDTFFTPAFAQMLTTTGFGSHPELVRGFAKVGSLLQEGKIILPEKGSDSKVAEKDAAKVLYPEHYDDAGKPKQLA